MYKEKVQEFINFCDKDVFSSRHYYIIDTMGVEYDRDENWCHVIRFNEPDADKLFKYLDTLNDGLVIFDRMDFWYNDENSYVSLYRFLKEFFDKLRELSVKNNLVIFT